MENVFLSLMQRISERLPELALVDEDYGQLETEEDTYPVTFPCVLLSPIEGDFENVAPLVQQGTATITVRLAMDCYDDTHYGSGTEDKVQERLQMNNRLYKSVQGFRNSNKVGPLSRMKTRNYTLPGGLKVYETTYQFKIAKDDSALLE